METRVHYILVGLFVLVLGMALVGVTMWLGMRPSAKNYNRYCVYMTESVSGLNRDSPVKYKGVDVGRVAQISLDKNNPERVRLLLEIEPSTPIQEDTLAYLEFQGLTGIAYVNLMGQKSDSPPLRAKADEPYPVIVSGPSLLMRLDVGVSRVLSSIAETADSINAFVGGQHQQALAESLAHLNQLLAALADRTESINSVILSAEHAMRQTAKTSDQLPHLVGELENAAAALREMADEVGRQSIIVGESTASGAQGIDRLSKGVNQLARDLSTEVHLLSADLRQVIDHFGRFAEELEQNPNALLFGKPGFPPGPGE